jgi:hypothetical protein
MTDERLLLESPSQLAPLPSRMPLSPPTVSRILAHSRRVRFEAYKRVDGLWDIEGHLTDIKPFDYPLSSGVRAAGTPIHDMWIRLTIDLDFNVIEASAVMDARPYPEACETIAPDYSSLVGLNLASGFRRAVHARFAGIVGCTHLTELAQAFPTAAIQALTSERRAHLGDETKPFQLDRCHALDTRSETVHRYYPRWYKKRMGAESALAGEREET